MAVDVDVEVAVDEGAVAPLLEKVARNAWFVTVLLFFLFICLVGAAIQLFLNPPLEQQATESVRAPALWTGDLPVPGPYDYYDLPRMLLDIRDSLNPQHVQIHVSLEVRVGAKEILQQYDAEIKAALVSVVGNRTLEELLGPMSIQQLQGELLPRINGILVGDNDPIVRSVLFLQMIPEQ